MIRKAEYTDIRRALDIYDSARRFMRSRGNAVQWVNGYPSEELLRADVAAGQLYVMEDAGGVYAVFAFIIGDDPTYQVVDGAWLDDGTPYGTLHRLGSDGPTRWTGRGGASPTCGRTPTRPTAPCGAAWSAPGSCTRGSSPWPTARPAGRMRGCRQPRVHVGNAPPAK